MTNTDNKRLADIWHDPWLTAAGPALCAIVDEAMTALGQRDDDERARRRVQGEHPRRPTADALATRTALIGNLFANLLLCKPPGVRVIINMSKRRVPRYEPPIFRQVLSAVKALAECGFVVRHRGGRIGVRSTLEPGKRLISAIERHVASPSDIGRVPIEEEECVLIAPRPERDPHNPRRIQRMPPIAYRDTPATRRMRAEMRTINTALAMAAVTLQGDAEERPPWRLQRRFSTNNPEARKQAFDLHGRLYGPSWWQGLKREERHRLRINSEPVADLDYRNMFVRLAYREVGSEPPEGDLYELPGVDPQWRGGIKRTFLAMLGKRGEFQRLNSEIRKLLPKGMTGREIAAAIEARHPRIAELFGTDLGIRLMRTESDVLVAVLLALAHEGIPALPMHDGLMVPASAKGRVKAIMEEVGKRTAGVRLPVEGKPIMSSISVN